MQSELKPCAHCGGEAYIDDDTMGHSVVCCKNIECRAQGPFRPTDDEAITAWNTRASDAEITRLTEALRAAEEEKKALREAMKGPLAWLERWAIHVGSCETSPDCTCGLLFAQHELRQALAGAKP